MADAPTGDHAYVRAAATLLGMNVDEDRMPAVVTAFDRIAAFARHIEVLPLDPTVEPAPAFEP